jgi:hypothetical protein
MVAITLMMREIKVMKTYLLGPKKLFIGLFLLCVGSFMIISCAATQDETVTGTVEMISISPSTPSSAETILGLTPLCNISNAEDLEKIREDSAGSFTLCNDIEVSDDFYPLPSFSGFLDGNGYGIYNLQDELFENLEPDAEIQNLDLD